MVKAKSCGDPIAAGESISVRGVGLQHTCDHLNCGAGGRVEKNNDYNRAYAADAMLSQYCTLLLHTKCCSLVMFDYKTKSMKYADKPSRDLNRPNFG